jgi:hypothetical protein
MASLDSIGQKIDDLKEFTDKRFTKVDGCIDKLFDKQSRHDRLISTHEAQIRHLEADTKHNSPFVYMVKGGLILLASIGGIGAFIKYIIFPAVR